VNNSETQIRILALVPYKVFPAVMGGQKGIALFYRYLAQSIPLACLTIKKNEANETFRVYNEISNERSRYINPLLFFKLNKLANSTESTHLLFEHPYYAWMIFLFKKFGRFKIIVHSHNIESERFKSIGKWWWKILWFYERMAYRLADKVWFKTDEDKAYADLYFKVHEEKCETIPYGVELNELPNEALLIQARKQIQSLYHIEENDKIILFNGTLSYKPNLDALRHILDQINPLLLAEKFNYKILICGKGLPKEMDELSAYADANIIHCGFVDDIDLYFTACDIFLNPLQDGGGIKTKLIEALGFGKKCVSSMNGAIGVDEALCGERLRVVADKDWAAYRNAILSMAAKEITHSHQAFYNRYSWKAIAKVAATSLLHAE
jgi:glycosyltransferase involved in cell wall biosynthesis